ncbi:hypothetical protein [Paenibacillus dakarensis]|uniref:hypothetical protein n=1 Tax=Paenibacillus dakarensis TaxID=1527293 RepID=UPI0009E98378|nr:hypothetical protein [Paenibacillus dakarensis]
MLLLSACSQSSEPEAIPDQSKSEAPTELVHINTEVKINKVHIDAKEDGGWWVVPQDAETLTINVEADHADTVLFWSAPTGTEVGKERELIGYDIDGEDGWSLKWNIKGQILHNHIDVQVLGMDGKSLTRQTFNLHTATEYDN